MKKIILIFVITQLFMNVVFSQQLVSYNVKSTTYLSEDKSDSVTSISYKDAFGRPMQDIVLNASPSGKDIVQTYQYDEYGRETKSYLPFTHNTQNGNFVDNALSLQTSFYNDRFPGKNAYSEVEYDNSPYNRIIKQSTAGEDINEVNISFEYTVTGGITKWIIYNNELIKKGTYRENSILKFTVKDADGKESSVYKDKSGKVLLKQQNLNGTEVNTRYVYDKYGQLRYVMPPEAVMQMTGTVYDINSTLVKQYCYYYEYNKKHQLVTKQLPGKEPVYLRYDSKYRLRMTQDGNQRAEDKWLFINYDYLGRKISTGLGYFDNDNDTIIQDTISPPADKSITAFLTYQYYDNYDFIDDNNLRFDSAQAYYNDFFKRVRGKQTGGKVRVMTDNEEKWLTSVIYYDKYGRVIQSISQNNLDGYDIISFKYDFSGKLLEKKQKHTAGQQVPKYLVYLYTYDNMGRLLKTELSQNSDASNPVIINQNEYNELGQVIQKKIHSENGSDFLQTEDFGYNIKGAITNINDPKKLDNDLFAMNLFYDNEIPDINQQTYEDGKISAIQWNSKNLQQIKTYTYEYDELNRLTKATYLPGNRYNVNIEYDLNGNITHLDRKGEIITTIKAKIAGNKTEKNKSYNLIDDLTYTYNGNRLIQTFDAVNEVNTQLGNDYHSIDIKSDEFLYDANGNMIKDVNKGIINITYNHLNQPVEIDFGTKKTVYTYTATGGMLKTEIYENGMLESTTEYNGAFVYKDNTLSYINIPGGRIVAITKEYQYNLTDHLGNVRVTFKKDTNGNAEIIQEDHYYPFGMRINGQHFTNTELINKYLYNGKELQDQTGYYDYGFRQYEAQLGRWHVIDAMAEKYTGTSPYAYVMNNPVNSVDIMGLVPMQIPYYYQGATYAGTADISSPALQWHNEQNQIITGWVNSGGSEGNGGITFSGYVTLRKENKTASEYLSTSRISNLHNSPGIGKKPLLRLWAKFLKKFFPKYFKKRLIDLDLKLGELNEKYRLPGTPYISPEHSKYVLMKRFALKKYIFDSVLGNTNTGQKRDLNWEIIVNKNFVKSFNEKFEGSTDFTRTFTLPSGVNNAELNITFDPIAIGDVLQISGGATFYAGIIDKTSFSFPLTSNTFTISVYINPTAVLTQWTFSGTITGQQVVPGIMRLLINGN